MDIFHGWITLDFPDKLLYENTRVSGGDQANRDRTGKKDLRKMDISWDEVEEAAEDRRSWRNRDAQRVFDSR